MNTSSDWYWYDNSLTIAGSLYNPSYASGIVGSTIGGTTIYPTMFEISGRTTAGKFFLSEFRQEYVQAPDKSMLDLPIADGRCEPSL